MKSREKLLNAPKNEKFEIELFNLLHLLVEIQRILEKRLVYAKEGNCRPNLRLNERKELKRMKKKKRRYWKSKLLVEILYEGMANLETTKMTRRCHVRYSKEPVFRATFEFFGRLIKLIHDTHRLVT